MGRAKNYDREQILEMAMGVFRDHGYASTSTQMLVDELGVNRFSLYAEFENKQNLFRLALERYNDSVVHRNFGPLETPTSGVEEVQALIKYFASAIAGPSAGRGCLLTNTAVEFGPEDPGGEGFVQRYFKRISAAFRNALGNAQRDGVLQETVSVKMEADFLTSQILGLFVMIRAKAPAAMVRNSAKSAMHHLDGLVGQ